MEGITVGTDGDRLEVGVGKPSTLYCPIWEPPATRSHVRIRSLKLNKIKMKSATLGAFPSPRWRQEASGCQRDSSYRTSLEALDGAGLAEPRGAGSGHLREAVGLLSSALGTLRVRGEASTVAMPNRQVGTWVWCSETGESRRHGAGSPQCPESG